MASNEKQRIRALREKGFSHQGAVQHLRAAKQAALAAKTKTASEQPIVAPAKQENIIMSETITTTEQPLIAGQRTAEAVVTQLQPMDMSSIRIGRVFKGGRSATLQTAIEQAQRPAMWFAETRTMQMNVSEAEFHLLKNAGATERGDDQVVHIRPGPHAYLMLSFECVSCRRFIGSGQQDNSGTCVCGQHYKVRFDASDDALNKMLLGWCCMDCGFKHAMTQPHEGRNPWRAYASMQQQCNRCFHEKGKPGMPMASFENTGDGTVCMHCRAPVGNDQRALPAFLRAHTPCETIDREHQASLKGSVTYRSVRPSN